MNIVGDNLRKKSLFFINGILLTFTSLILRLIGMSFSIYISNKIGSKATGVFELVMSIYMFFVTFALSGINLACTRVVTEDIANGSNENVKATVKKCLLYSLFFGSISSLAICILAPFLSNVILHNQVSSLPFYAISISLPFVAMSSCINGYFSAVRHVAKSAFVQILEQIIKIFSISFLISRFMPSTVDFTIISLVLGDSLSEIISFLILYFLYRLEKRKLIDYRYSPSKLSKKILSISMPVAITSYIKSGLSSLKQILIPISLEKYGLGCSDALSFYGMINGMAFPVILFPNLLIMAFSGLLIPEFSYSNAKNEKNKIKYMLTKAFKYTLIFSFIVVIILVLFSKYISKSLFNEVELSKYIIYLAPLVIFMYLDNVIDSMLKGLNKQTKVMKINIIDLLTTIFFILFLLPVGGEIGYIIILYISEILNCLLSLRALLKT